MARILPTITKQEDPARYLKVWERRLQPLVRRIPAARVPWNFSAEGRRGGVYLTWRETIGADGYEIERAESVDMLTNPFKILLSGVLNVAHFDAVSPTSGGTGTVTRYYRIRSTSGSLDRPQEIRGLWSSVISAQTIDPTDTTTTRNPNFDLETDDDWQSRVRKINRIYYY